MIAAATHSYRMPTRVTFGVGALARLRDIPSLAGARSVALFAGERSLRAGGTLEWLQRELGDRRLDIFDPVPPEPQVVDLERATDWLREAGSDAVLAVGGGSVIDLGKAAAFCVRQEESPRSLLRPLTDAMRPPLPMIAVPTTAGSGSEVSPFAVLWDRVAGKKHSLDHPSLFPIEALVDPELTCSLPPELTASTGLDAFTQACESYWNRNANPVSDGHALRAVETIRRALPGVVRHGNDLEARTQMMRGSLEAGLAFSNTRTGACHSISYPMTLHFRVRHGQAVAVTLPELLPLNMRATLDGETGMERPAAEARSQAFLEALGVTSPKEAAEAVRALIQESGLETRLSRLDVDRAGVEILVAEGFTPARMGNNPYTFTSETLRSMLLRLL
jgi:phosphonate metabolism-associated iron-containing alcohol dehydrogenase